MILFCVICGVLILGAGVAAYVTYNNPPDKVCGGLAITLVTALVVIPAAYTIAAWNGGVEPNYERGYVVGTIIQARNHGAIADTCEITLQQGMGEHREAIELSMSQCDMFEFEVGAEVMIDYTGYWVPDFRRGLSGRYVNRILQVPWECSL